MAGFFAEYGIFLAKTITVVVAVIIILSAALANTVKERKDEKGKISVIHLNRQLGQMKEDLQKAVLDKDSFKAERKRIKKQQKEAEKKPGKDKKRLFVLNFNGDTKASAVESLRQEVTTVLTLADKDRDEVLLKLESPGGEVHSYGLAASQLHRLRQASIPLTVAVDKVAASGGYMMACLGNKIISAPFAYVGSIGVLLQQPNFHRVLKKHDVDFEMITAGEYKRTLTIFGENTDKDRAKVKEEVEEIHQLFKRHVHENRPLIDIDKVATGEVWVGAQALENKLVDAVMTSDQYIVDACEEAEVYEVSFEQKKKFKEKLGSVLESTVSNGLDNWLQKRSKESYYS